MISIVINKTIKTYRGLSRLQVADEIPAGSVTKVYGPSGAGKTTFLKVIAGLITPDNGTIKVDNETWLSIPGAVNWSPQQRRVGFVFQDYALFPHMTALQHLQYATKDQQLIHRLLEMAKMEGIASHRPRHLSGGQQQRLAILRAMAQKPKILLMDEAFSALDDELREELIDSLKIILSEFGTTTIIVSHHAHETLGFADRSLKIDL